MRVRMNVQPVGEHDSEPWPETGTELDLPKDQALAFVTCGWAVPLEDFVMEGSVAQVVEWVGEDHGRVRSALKKERAAEKPRASLIKKLEQILP